MRARFVSQDAAKTKRLGAVFAEELLRTDPGRRALVVALIGDLGAGKTTFTQGLAKALGVRRRTPSPTFILMRAYPARRGRTLYHIDCYRIARPGELLELGWRDWISHPDHIVIIEWAEKISRILPKNAIHIYFRHGKKQNERIVTIQR